MDKKISEMNDIEYRDAVAKVPNLGPEPTGRELRGIIKELKLKNKRRKHGKEKG